MKHLLTEELKILITLKMSGQHNEICLKSINEILGMSFYIPDYQRGYRWGNQQVKDLLNDINEYKIEGSNFYCLQPLVVKNKRDEEKILSQIKEKTKLNEVEKLLEHNLEWEVIDGQQRLTTLYIILKALGNDTKYSLKYQTRDKSEKFLDELGQSNSYLDKNSNIDFYHINRAFNVVEKWIENKSSKEKDDFKKKILDHVKFIWYESKEENPIEVFTRLNIGKIGLTNAELIKALVLNSSNFNKSDMQVRQETIALEWDNIEYTLQNDEFWYFLNNIGNEKATRIDFIFDIIKDKDYLQVKNKFNNIKTYKEIIGNDGYQTFRYFYEHFKKTGEDINKEKLLKEAWDKVKEIFRTFKEWYDDLEFYHYIGFLINFDKKTANDIISYWKEDEKKDTSKENAMKGKEGFKSELIKEIKEHLISVMHNNRTLDKNTITLNDILNQEYEGENKPTKTKCKPILLLHNVQTIINQNKLSTRDYGEQIFQKFPFHIFKKEKWDVEHIDSNTENTLEKIKDQKEWLLNSLLDPVIAENSDNISNEIYNFINNQTEDNNNNFSKLKEKIESISIGGDNNRNKLSEDKKNKIWNFVLLDSKTNRGYGNSLFSVKRRWIIGKDQGKKFQLEINENENENESEILKKYKFIDKEADSSFIPPCTKYVFMKYYNPISASIQIWDRDDANHYKENIKETLKIFFHNDDK